MKQTSFCSTIRILFVAVSVIIGLSFVSYATVPPLGPPLAGQKQPGVSKQSLPKGASENWWATVQKQIRDDEYQINWSDHPSFQNAKEAWQADNPEQGFNSFFTEGGLKIAPVRKLSENGKEASWEWGLSLISWGRNGSENKVKTVKPTISKNRADYTRDGIQEWYLNTEKGLEQGFVLPAPPAGSGIRSGESGEKEHHFVHIDLALTGTLHPTFAENGQAVDFFDGGNIAVLHYGSLKVTDANGQKLKARMEGFADNGGGIRIVIDDGNAAYPITVDPLATSPAWTAAGEGGYNSFGYSVSPAGDVNGDGYSDVLVGSYG